MTETTFAPTFTSFADLAAFLMVHVAHVDGQVHYLEEATLTEQMRQFSGDPDQRLREATQMYLSHSGLKVEEVLESNETLIKNSSYEERMDLIWSLYGIINSDGRVQEEEMGTLRAIRSALEQSTAPTVLD